MNRWILSAVDVTTDVVLGVAERLTVIRCAVGALIGDWRDGR